MGGFFGVVSKEDCVEDLYYGTDYHSHLGTVRGGLAVLGNQGFQRQIHSIEVTPFRSKFEEDIQRMGGGSGIGVISDTDNQPIIIKSHLDHYAIVTVGRINNMAQLVAKALKESFLHFSEMSGGEINQTELVATLINQGDTIENGIHYAQKIIGGSCSLLLLTEKGIYAARDKLGRTPVIIGRREGVYAVTIETSAFPNLGPKDNPGYEIEKYLGPGEIVLITPDGIEQLQAPGNRLQICAFLWVYYGFPASDYEGINVEVVRYLCGAALARNDKVRVDFVAGIPDSGTAHGLGYASEARIPFCRPYVKYTPTWPRSFMPQDQEVRDLVAWMKLIPIRKLIDGKRLLFCEDSIVRGTQLQDTIQRLFVLGAKEIHMRPACPPLIYGCKFLNFSRSRSELDLAGRRAIDELEGEAGIERLTEYANPDSDRYAAMVKKVQERLNLTTLHYQRLPDLVEAIGLPKEKLCTYCWDGAG